MNSTNAGGQRPCDQLSMSRFSFRRQANKRNIQTRIKHTQRRVATVTEYIQGLCRISLSISLFFSQLFISSRGGKKYSARDIVDTSHRWPHTCLLSFCFVFSNFKKERHLGFCRTLSHCLAVYTHTSISLIPPSVLVFFLYTSFFYFMAGLFWIPLWPHCP